MRYDDLFQLYLNSYSDSRYGKQGSPKAYMMPPEKIQALINSFSPYDLYTKPNDYPSNFSTSAVTMRPFGKLGISDIIMLMANQPAKNQLSSIFDIGKQFRMNPNSTAPAIYEHELGHYSDPSLLNFNRGFLMKDRLPTSTGFQVSEFPAWRNERRLFEGY